MMFQFSNCNLKGQGGLQIHFVKNRFKVLPDKIFSGGHFAKKIRKIYFSVPNFRIAISVSRLGCRSVVTRQRLAIS